MRERLAEWHPALRFLVGALLGMALAVGVGLVAVALAPKEGFGDLAAAAVTVVFGLPAGALLGGVVLYWLGRARSEQAEQTGP